MTPKYYAPAIRPTDKIMLDCFTARHQGKPFMVTDAKGKLGGEILYGFKKGMKLRAKWCSVVFIDRDGFIIYDREKYRGVIC